MKKLLQGTAVLFVLSLVFSACMKNNDSQTVIPSGGLMAFNLAADADAVGIRLDGNNLVNQPLLYTNFTGAYLPIYVGNRTAWAYDYYSGNVLTQQVPFVSVDSQYYSLFVVSADSNYKTVVVNDHLDTLNYDAGHAFVRYINAIGDSTQQPLVKFNQAGADVVSEAAAFAHVSGFSKLAAGNTTVSVKVSTGIDTSRSVELEANKVYTVLLLGKPGATGDKAVQIKYIVNGTVEANDNQ